MFDEIDLEDIECRLYSQVYHFSAENEGINLPPESSLTLNTNDKRHNPRYFSKGQTFEQPSFIPLEEKDGINSGEIGSVYSSVSFNPNPTGTSANEGNLAGNRFQNNITVNQYTVPFIINPELSEVLSPSYNNRKYFVPWCVENKKLLDKKNRKRLKKLEKRRRNKAKVNQNNFNNLYVETNERTLRKVNDTVYISDDSDSECMIVNEMVKENPKSRKLKSGSPKTSNDGSDSDDIIYVPPPPVEVINVDEEEEVNDETVCEVLKDGNKSTVTENVSTCINSDLLADDKTNNLDPHGLSPESCTSNDFLDNSSVDNNTNKFNFGLHGSDFNNTGGDFVRPANPIDYCETESSCSTNDFNREGNCVKTIVFSEVDFPKEDIFSDKNLEDFGSYITPKRKTLKEPKTHSVVKLGKSVKKSFDDIESSSSSSSETDCESPYSVNKNDNMRTKELNKKLPTLSPMLCDKNTVKTKSKSLKDNNLQISKKRSKHSDKTKCNVSNSTESDDDTNVEESKLTKKKLSKKKKAANKKRTLSENQNKQTVKNIIQDNDLNRNNPDTEKEEEIVPATINTFVGKRSSICDTTLSKDIHYGLSGKDTSAEYQNLTEHNKNDDNLEASNVNLEKNNTSITPSRKKKRHSESKKSEIESASSSGETISEKTKKKKRKSICSENLVVDRETVELNESLLEIHGKNNENVENELEGKEHSKTDPPKSADTLRKLSQEPNLEDTVELQNMPSYDHLTGTETEDQANANIGENCTGKGLSESPKLPDLNILANNENSGEIVIIDEVLSDESDTNGQSCVEIVSSDSEYDFHELDDVGRDLTLANCSVPIMDNEFINVDNRSYFNVINKNLNQDYSKFDVEEIQNTQTDDPNAWKILPGDQQMLLLTNNNKGPRCNRCRHFGHIAIRCKEKPDPPNCTLCGLSGHQEPRCPHKICTQCGNEGDYSTTYCWKCVKFRNSICRLCNMRGHLAKTCPDLWRRYHLTTKKGPVVVSEEPQLKPRDQLWCSGCAGQGHLEHECNYYNREYPPSNPCIVSYEDIWQQDRNMQSDDRTVTPALPPQPIWNIHQQHFYGNMPPVPYHNLPSTSHEVLPFIPPLMSQTTNINALMPASVIEQSDTTFSPNNMDSDLTIGPTTVLNPFSVLITKGNNTELNRMLLDYINDGNNINHMGSFDNRGGKLVIHPHLVKVGTNELLRNDQRRVKQIIMSMPAHVVKQFIRKELADLENIVSDTDPKYLKKKLFKYDRITQSKRPLNCDLVKEMCFWNRILNMFIFGVHQFKDGKLHINFIKRYATESKHLKLSTHKRKSLLSAYTYIFDASRHNVNYYKVMQNLIQKQNSES